MGSDLQISNFLHSCFFIYTSFSIPLEKHSHDLNLKVYV